MLSISSWNVFGKVPADPHSEDKDQVVLLGNHRGNPLLYVVFLDRIKLIAP